MVQRMAESYEFEFRKKLIKIREEMGKRELDVRGSFANIEKIKVDALKKTEELKYSAQHEMEKIEQDIVKTADLNGQMRARLVTEINALKDDVGKTYTELRNIVLGKTTY
jgi:hypothetical protein